jgi:hypothetical protein
VVQWLHLLCHIEHAINEANFTTVCKHTHTPPYMCSSVCVALRPISPLCANTHTHTYICSSVCVALTTVCRHTHYTLQVFECVYCSPRLKYLSLSNGSNELSKLTTIQPKTHNVKHTLNIQQFILFVNYQLNCYN